MGGGGKNIIERKRNKKKTKQQCNRSMSFWLFLSFFHSFISSFSLSLDSFILIFNCYSIRSYPPPPPTPPP